MLATLTIVLPIFALVLAGWVSRRTGVLGPHASRELNRFVVYLALPALLLDIVAHARWAEVWQPGFAAAFGLGAAAIFAGAVALCLSRRRRLADAAIDGLNAAYANTGFVGFPLAAAALGRQALAPALVATLITVCILFGVAIAMIEAGQQTQPDGRHLARGVLGSLLRNPLLVAPLLGALFPLGGLEVPAPIETFLKLLGAAASPCALIALGLFLAAERPGPARNHRPVTGLVALKLVAQPAVTWMFAVAFRLPPQLTHSAVLLAALPTGTGPFMLAEFYQREASITSSVILVSTLVSVLTLTLYLAMIG